MVQPLWKTVCKFLKKIKTGTIWSSNPTSGYLSKELKSGSQRDISTPMFITALFTIAKIVKQAKCLLVDEWIKKMWHIHTMEYYSVLKKEGNPAIYDNMNGPWGYYAKWNKPITEEQILHDFTNLTYLKWSNS